MVHNHLNTLTNSIAEIHPNLLTGCMEEDLQKWIGFIAVSADHICHQLKKEVFAQENEKQMEYFIQTHQLAFLTIIGDLQHYILLVSNTQPVQPHLKKFYLTVTSHVQAILNFILQHFSKYFNMCMDIPFNYLPVVRRELGEEVQAIKRGLSSMESVQLLSIALEPIMDFIEKESQKITYCKLQYYKLIIKELKEIDPKEDVNCAIRTSLFYLNFNSRRFLKYAVELALEEVSTVSNEIERKDKLLWVIKSLKQLRIKPNCKFSDSDPGVYDYVLKYLSEEVGYLNTRLQVPSEEIHIDNPLEAQTPKINTTLSLSQMAALFKVFFDAGIITNQTKIEVWRALSVCFRTNKRKSFSTESVRTLYNNVDPATGKSVIDLLFKLLNSARKLY